MHSDLQALPVRQPALLRQFAPQRPRRVAPFVNLLAASLIIGQFHDVIEPVRTATHVEDVELAGMTARDGLEALDARQFPLEGAVILEIPPVDELHRAPRAHDIARQPNLAVTAPANRPDQRVIGNGKRRQRASATGATGRRERGRDGLGIRHDFRAG